MNVAIVHAYTLNVPRFWGKSDILHRGADPGGVAIFIIQWLTEHSWPHLVSFTARRSRR